MKVGKWEILAIVIVAVIALSLWYFKPFSQQTPPSATNSGGLTIASISHDVSGELSPVLELEIFDCGVDHSRGYHVVCSGRVNMIRGSQVSGARVGMYIVEERENSVHVEIYVYRGELALPLDFISFDQVDIPTLTPSDYSFEFSLTCSYS